MLFIDGTGEYEQYLYDLIKKQGNYMNLEFPSFMDHTSTDEILERRVDTALGSKLGRINNDYYMLMMSWLEHLHKEYNLPSEECEFAMTAISQMITEITEHTICALVDNLGGVDMISGTEPEELAKNIDRVHRRNIVPFPKD